MSRADTTRYAFNRGIVSHLALGRVDLKRTALSAALQTNWMARSLGSMMLRPGLQYLGNTAANALPRYIRFVRSISAMYLLEFTDSALRVWSNDALVTRLAVSTTITNGTFDTNLAGWTNNDEAGATSAWVTGGYMGLTGTGSAAAIRDQQLTIAADNQNVEHALRIVVTRGPVMIRVGTAVGDDTYINEATLYAGTHSLSFTPTGATVWVRFFSRLTRQILVDSCTIEGAGVMSLPSPYLAANLDSIRAGDDTLSVDVMFMACTGFEQRRVERRNGGRSWSITLYQPEDGPFRTANTSTQTMTPSVLNGNGTLTSSTAFFRSGHAGALFAVTSTGQKVTVTVTGQNQFSSAIKITGVGADRAIAVAIDTVGAGTTIRIQRSLDSNTGPWSDVSGESFTAATGTTFNDTLDNQIIWYRIGCKTGEYGAGTSVCTLQSSIGTIEGVCRITSVTSNLVCNMEVVSDFGGTAASSSWREGQWSDYRGWPSAGALYEGRMNWDGFDQIVFSVSDQFDGFDDSTVGDSGPINRTIGAGPLDTINWALPLQRLVLGALLAEHSVRTTALDEPVTPTNFNRKAFSTQGSANVQAQKIDSRGVFVQRGGNRVFEVGPDPESYDYKSEDLTLLNPDVCKPKVTRLDVQRRPDTRIHCVLSDGTVAVQVYDRAEKINCWIKIETPGATGLVVDVVVLPGIDASYEDQVYYAVQRTINGSTVVCLEKWATEDQAIGAAVNKMADCAVLAAGGSTTVSAPHLPNTSVIVWGNGKDLGTYTTDGSGNATVTEAIDSTGATIGLTYEARFQSAKLGETIGHYKAIDHIAPVLQYTHQQGLWHGQDFTHMDNLPLDVDGAIVDGTGVHTDYDRQPQEFVGDWSTDTRLCLRAVAPRPCTVLCVAISGQVSE